MHTDRNSFRERVPRYFRIRDTKKGFARARARAFPRLRSLNTMSIKNDLRQMKIFQATVNTNNGWEWLYVRYIIVHGTECEVDNN